MGQGGGQLTGTDSADFLASDPAKSMEYGAIPGVDYPPIPGQTNDVPSSPERPPVLDAISRSRVSPIFEALRHAGRRL